MQFLPAAITSFSQQSQLEGTSYLLSKRLSHEASNERDNWLDEWTPLTKYTVFRYNTIQYWARALRANTALHVKPWQQLASSTHEHNGNRSLPIVAFTIGMEFFTAVFFWGGKVISIVYIFFRKKGENTQRSKHCKSVKSVSAFKLLLLTVSSLRKHIRIKPSSIFPCL